MSDIFLLLFLIDIDYQKKLDNRGAETSAAQLQGRSGISRQI
jgi:hypothetical protein